MAQMERNVKLACLRQSLRDKEKERLTTVYRSVKEKPDPEAENQDISIHSKQALVHCTQK